MCQDVYCKLFRMNFVFQINVQWNQNNRLKLEFRTWKLWKRYCRLNLGSCSTWAHACMCWYNYKPWLFHKCETCTVTLTTWFVLISTGHPTRPASKLRVFKAGYKNGLVHPSHNTELRIWQQRRQCFLEVRNDLLWPQNVYHLTDMNFAWISLSFWPRAT